MRKKESGFEVREKVTDRRRKSAGRTQETQPLSVLTAISFLYCLTFALYTTPNSPGVRNSGHIATLLLHYTNMILFYTISNGVQQSYIPNGDQKFSHLELYNVM